MNIKNFKIKLKICYSKTMRLMIIKITFKLWRRKNKKFNKKLLKKIKIKLMIKKFKFQN